MATVRSLTADKIYAIEAATVVDAEIRGDNLILITHDGTEIDVGSIRGPVGASGDHHTLTNLTLDDHPQYLPLTGSRPMTGPLVLQGDPNQPLGAVTRQYGVGRGASMRVTGSVPSEGSSQTRLTYAANSFIGWGNVTRSGDSLVCPVEGWYKLGFAGVFGSSEVGNVRLMSLGTDTDPTGSTDADGNVPGPLGDVPIAAHISEPTIWSSGYGAVVSAYGIGYVSYANTKVSVWARQDSGAALPVSARFSIELLRTS